MATSDWKKREHVDHYLALVDTVPHRAEGESVLLEQVPLAAPRILDLGTGWRSRYQSDGLDGLRDRPKTGRPPTHGSEVRAKLIALACTRPPDTDEGVRRERWTHAELAERVGMSESQAHAILRGADIRPHLTEYWVMSELGPDFDARDPPQNAIVVSIDEKTSIAAREPARPDTQAGAA